MTVKDLVLNSLESFADFYIDLETTKKQLTKNLYLQLADYEIASYYLDIENNKPCIVIKLENY